MPGVKRTRMTQQRHEKLLQAKAEAEWKAAEKKAKEVPFTLEDLLREKQIRSGQLMKTMYPDSGRYRRELYEKHVAFLNAGSQYRERAMIAANQVGKSQAGAYETACHLTGLYPDWWQGKRFIQAPRGWACGDTSKTLREIIQVKLLGPIAQRGTGMLPADTIHHVTMRGGTPDAVDTIYVHHTSGQLATVVLKAYDQRRESFQGATLDFIWLDEEPPNDIYVECLLRTATTGGIIYLTFTPLYGWTTLIDAFFKDSDRFEGKKKTE